MKGRKCALVLLSVGRIVHRSVVFMLVAVFNDKWTDAVSEAFPRIPLFIVRYLEIYLLYFKQLRIECMVNLKNSLLDNKVYVL